jgi:L-cysteine desulfidase
MGCTEPIAVAYAAALARKTLGCLPESVVIRVSANIIKNVKSVVVPHTGGLRGIAAAASAGIVAGNAEGELEVISTVRPEQIPAITAYLQRADFDIAPSESDYIFDIQITVAAGGDSAFVQIAGGHTNVIGLRKNGEVLIDREYVQGGQVEQVDHSLLSVESIVEFADCVDVAAVKPTLDRQIALNTAIAEEGLSGKWGANIGTVLLRAYGDTVHNRAKAWAAAGSDARMSGCEKPVVINSGSGNQGLTASLPVIVYAKELGASEEQLYRALVVSNLVTIHLKTGIGRLSAYCGATSAGCGAGAGISYLYGGRYREIAHTIVNAVAINSGMICDGAKASCAAKIASAVDAGILGWEMYCEHQQFYGGDGIVTKSVENTIKNVGRLAKYGMAKTDKEIIDIMISDPNN